MLKVYLAIVAVLLIVFVIYKIYKRKASNSEEDKVASFTINDPTIQSYQDTAQKQLQYLIDWINTHEKNEKLYRYAIKSNFKEADNGEHMWVQVSDFKDGYFIGRLANEPNTIKKIKYGDSVKVHRNDVEDWILEDFVVHAKVGGFSQEYLRKNGK